MYANSIRRPRITLETWAWAMFKLALGFGWTTSVFLITPLSIEQGIPAMGLLVWTIGTMIGAAISIVGMFMSTSRNEKRSLRGLTVELIGIVLFIGGPIQFFFILFGLLDNSFQGVFHLLNFSFAMILAIFARGVQIATRFYREATDPTKQVNKGKRKE